TSRALPFTGTYLRRSPPATSPPTEVLYFKAGGRLSPHHRRAPGAGLPRPHPGGRRSGAFHPFRPGLPAPLPPVHLARRHRRALRSGLDARHADGGVAAVARRRGLEAGGGGGR